MRPRKVTRNAGKNPVARAVARKHLESTLTTYKLRIYTLAEGEPCEDMCESVGMVLAIIGYGAALAGLGDSPPNRVLRGGLSACQQMLLTGKWTRLNTVALDHAIDAAQTLNTQVGPDYINRAWIAMTSPKKG